MRSGTLGAAVLVAVLFPQLGKAQVFQFASPAPPAATTADWVQQRGPLLYAGDVYYPTGPTVFFDPYVMVRTGLFRGVPLYADTTLEPYSVVYVPIGGNVMRPYEKRRAGTSEGTVGSRTPSFPVEHDVDVSTTTDVTGLQYPPIPGVTPGIESDAAPPFAVGTAGRVVAPARPVRAAANGPVEIAGPPRPTHVESIPQPHTNSGIWVPYAGATWYANGDAVAFVPDHFVRVGEYHGFPVYRGKDDGSGRIYIPSVEGGPLTPYRKR